MILFPRALIKRNSIEKNLEIKEKINLEIKKKINLEIKEKKALVQHLRSLIKNPTNSRKMEIKINLKKKKIKTNNPDLKSAVKSKKSPSLSRNLE